MFPNLIFVVVAALVPLVMGFIYYHPKVFGNAWMKACGLTKEKLEGANMLVVFGVTWPRRICYNERDKQFHDLRWRSL